MTAAVRNEILVACSLVRVTCQVAMVTYQQTIGLIRVTKIKCGKIASRVCIGIFATTIDREVHSITESHSTVHAFIPH